jgi:hypothetical protein
MRTIRRECFPECASVLTSARLPTGIQSAGKLCGFNSSNDPFVQGLSAAAADNRHAQATADTDEKNMALVLQQRKSKLHGVAPECPMVRAKRQMSQARLASFYDASGPIAFRKSHRARWASKARIAGHVKREGFLCSV